MLWKLDCDHFMRSLIILKAHFKIIARLNSSQSQAHMSLLNIPQKSIKALLWINYECFMWHLQLDINSFWPDCLFLLFAITTCFKSWNFRLLSCFIHFKLIQLELTEKLLQANWNLSRILSSSLQAQVSWNTNLTSIIFWVHHWY